MITFTNVRYKTLSVDSLVIPEGITSVIGRNGSGKTTLLKVCAGIHLPEMGTICVNGKTPREIETGWVNEFPDRNILFNEVSDEIASSLRFRQVPCSEVKTRVSAQMEYMGIDYLEGQLIRDLSGGEKILVALAAALVHNPEILVLDEYDSHLDKKRTDEIENILRRSQISHVIRCTQQMETAARGDYVIFLENGKPRHLGNPVTVFSALKDSLFYPLTWRIPV